MVERCATVHGESVVLRGGVNERPRAAMLQDGASVSSSCSGTMRRMRPSSTSTCTGPPVVRLVSRRTPCCVASMLRISVQTFL